jgi:hypothetical protein
VGACVCEGLARCLHVWVDGETPGGKVRLRVAGASTLQCVRAGARACVHVHRGLCVSARACTEVCVPGHA